MQLCTWVCRYLFESLLSIHLNIFPTFPQFLKFFACFRTPSMIHLVSISSQVPLGQDSFLDFSCFCLTLTSQDPGEQSSILQDASVLEFAYVFSPGQTGVMEAWRKPQRSSAISPTSYEGQIVSTQFTTVDLLLDYLAEMVLSSPLASLPSPHTRGSKPLMSSP